MTLDERDNTPEEDTTPTTPSMKAVRRDNIVWSPERVEPGQIWPRSEVSGKTWLAPTEENATHYAFDDIRRPWSREAGSVWNPGADSGKAWTAGMGEDVARNTSSGEEGTWLASSGVTWGTFGNTGNNGNKGSAWLPETQEETFQHGTKNQLYTRKRIILLILVMLLIIGSAGGVLVIRHSVHGNTDVQQPGSQGTSVIPPTASTSSSDYARLLHNSPTQTVSPGKLYEIQFVYENIGTTTWSDTDGYQLRCSGSDCTGNKSVSLYGQKIVSGQECVFNAHLMAPPTAGTYSTTWNMTHSGRSFGDQVAIKVVVKGSATSLSRSSMQPTPTTPSPAKDSSLYVTSSMPVTALPGQAFTMSLTFVNNGANTWSDSSGYALSCNTAIAYVDCMQGGSVSFNQQSVAPGQAFTFTMTLVAPNSGPGSYTTAWIMTDNGNPFGDNSAIDTLNVLDVIPTAGPPTSGPIPVTPIPITPTVATPPITPTVVTVTPTTPASVDNTTLVTQSPDPTIQTGQSFSISFTLQNTGNTTWSDSNGYVLACLSNCLGASNSGFNGQIIGPGQNYQFTITQIAPSAAATYQTVWIMQNTGSGTTFGPTLSINVTAIAPVTPTATPAMPTPTPSSTASTTLTPTPSLTPTSTV